MDMSDEWLSGLCAWASGNDNVRELWLFGSRAKGTSQSQSDVDIAVDLMPCTSAMMTYNDSSEEWKDELRAIVGRDISLVAIGPGFDMDTEVRSSGKLLWRRK
jgi:predicted nucleotidyltransferase